MECEYERECECECACEDAQLAVDSFTYLGIPDFGELGRVGQSWASSDNRIIIVITRNGD